VLYLSTIDVFFSPSRDGNVLQCPNNQFDLC
jgi:hypothetical protein